MALQVSNRERRRFSDQAIDGEPPVRKTPGLKALKLFRGCAGIRAPRNAASAVAVTRRLAFHPGRRFRRNRAEPSHPSAQGARPPPSPMPPPLLRVPIRGVFVVKGGSCVLLACGGAAGNHRSCAVPETRKANHRNVDQQEQHKSQRDKEVNGACGLAATEQSNGPGKGRGKAEGHRQATPDDQGEQNENYEEVREALERVVGRGLCRARPFKAERLCE